MSNLLILGALLVLSIRFLDVTYLSFLEIFSSKVSSRVLSLLLLLALTSQLLTDIMGFLINFDSEELHS